METCYLLGMKDYSSAALDRVSVLQVMRAPSDPCRIAIVRTILKKGELACNEVPLKIAKATRSHHFTILREAGLLSTRTAGTKCLSSIRKDEVGARFPESGGRTSRKGWEGSPEFFQPHTAGFPGKSEPKAN